jgi:flagellar assembly protein FliH
MGAPARFLFDVDFAAMPTTVAPEPPSEPAMTVAEHEARLAEAVRRAFEDGRAKGEASASVRAADRLAEEAGRLAAAAQSILGVLDVERRRIEADAMRLAEVIGGKLAGALIERQPRQLILGILSDAMAPLRKAPHLVVRLAETDAEPIRAELARLAAERGFEGRLVVLGEDGMRRGDCRVEWADGGMVFDRAVVEAAIEQAIDNHLLPVGDTADDAAANGVST